MAWRAVNSILVLRDQADILAPGRDKGSDGTICNESHPSTSDHCPHYVPGLGSDMVTALDLTHDPAGGFDSFLFAEILRVHRDARIKYVISNSRVFSSYSTSSRAAWTWGPYADADKDPHTNHVHVSVLDATISDTSTAWNLEGFNDMEQGELLKYRIAGAPNRTVGQAITDGSVLRDWWVSPEGAAADAGSPPPGSREYLLHKRVADTAAKVAALESKLDQILAKLNQPTPNPGTPVAYNFTGTATPKP